MVAGGGVVSRGNRASRRRVEEAEQMRSEVNVTATSLFVRKGDKGGGVCGDTTI